MLHNARDTAAENRAIARKARAAAKPKAPAATEAMVQRSIRDRLRLSGIMTVHVMNEGNRSLNGNKLARANGMAPGFPDLLCYAAGQRHGVMEVKAPGWTPPKPPKLGMKPSAAFQHWQRQADMHARLRDLGVPVAVVTSLDEAVAAVKGWGWLT